MATVAQVRIILGDIAKFDRQTATGDGSTKKFKLSSLPVITGSDAVAVAGVDQTRGTDYTLDAELGVITFTTAPGAVEVAATFSYAEISDESITAILALQSNPYIAAAMCARSIAGRYSSLVDKQVGDLRISYSQRAKTWAEFAKKLETMQQPVAATSPWLGSLYVDDKEANAIDTSVTQPFFRRDMETNPAAADETA